MLAGPVRVVTSTAVPGLLGVALAIALGEGVAVLALEAGVVGGIGGTAFPVVDVPALVVDR